MPHNHHIMAMNEQYINSIAEEQPLSDAEERQLAKRIEVGDAEALEKLTKHNLKYVLSIAHQYRGRGVAEDDLVSEGNIALMHAAAKFDGTRGVRFVVFAAPYIRQAMEQAILEQGDTYGTTPHGRQRSGRTTPRHISLDQSIPAGSKSAFTLHSVIEDINSPQADSGLSVSVIRAQLRQGMTALNERERCVISCLYGLNGDVYTMAETGERMGLKRERVRQIRDKALRKLSRKLKR